MQQSKCVRKTENAAPIPSDGGKQGNEAGNGNNGSFLRIINVCQRIYYAGKTLLGGAPVPGLGVHVYRCRTCNGTGLISNPWFEICLESGFDRGEMSCRECSYRCSCSRGPEIKCGHCKDGYLVVRLNEFEPCGRCA